MDEPERGMHPTAQRHMFGGLVEWGWSRPILVATHTPAAFQNPRVRLAHVHRDEAGSTVISPMEDHLRGLLQGIASEELGLDPADLLQAIRLFVIMEGEHDLEVLNPLLDLDMASHRIKTMAMRGTRGLKSVLDASFILEFTTAKVIIVLDHTRGELVSEVWESAKRSAEAGDRDTARRTLDALKGNSNEERQLLEFCRKAIDAGIHDRFDVFGFAKPDIIWYLPVEKIVPDATSWESLEAERLARDRRMPFKTFLHERKRATFSAEELGSIAREMDVIPEEVSKLRDLCLKAIRQDPNVGRTVEQE